MTPGPGTARVLELYCGVPLEERGRFMGASDDFEASDIVLVGAPLDATASARSGARQGPVFVRMVSDILEDYSPALGLSLYDALYFDAGDLVLPPGNLRSSLDRIGRAVSCILARGKLPVVLGGEHLLTLPCVEAVAAAEGDPAVLCIDAHADLREEYLGERDSHATVMRRVCERVGASNVFQVGVRSGTREEFDFAARNLRSYRDSLPEAVSRAVTDIGRRPTYVTIDIDVVDPAFAPGTGSPEPGGPSSADLLEALTALGRLKLAGLDVVEVCPPLDSSGVTSLLAAKVVREAILARYTDG